MSRAPRPQSDLPARTRPPAAAPSRLPSRRPLSGLVASPLLPFPPQLIRKPSGRPDAAAFRTANFCSWFAAFVYAPSTGLSIEAKPDGAAAARPPRRPPASYSECLQHVARVTRNDWKDLDERSHAADGCAGLRRTARGDRRGGPAESP